jgi:hypothetical protein
MEVTFQEVRAHLGVETQRQWSVSEDEQRIRSKAIARTTPALLGLFSLVTLMAQELHLKGKLVTKNSAWYQKTLPTFSDAIASVREALWSQSRFSISCSEDDMIKIPRQQLLLFQQALAWAA